MVTNWYIVNEIGRFYNNNLREFTSEIASATPYPDKKEAIERIKKFKSGYYKLEQYAKIENNG